jgi:hypothetical protein
MSRTTKSRQTPRAILSWIVRKLRGLLISGTEMVLAVALVLVFALVFLLILVVSFPKGTGLVDFYQELVDRGARGARVQWQDPTGDDSAFVAVLTRVQRRVRDRSAGAVSWNKAHAGMRLQDQHTIQTLARSAATISIGSASELQLGERSLVVVQRESPPRGLRGRRSSIVLLGGRIEGRITGGAGRAARLAVVTAGGESELRARGTDATDFTVTLNPDDSSTISVHSGLAEITTSDGSMQVGPNQAITYDPTGFLGATESIPPAPALLAPAEGAVHTYGAVSPRVRFRWAEQEAADAYHFVLARDRDLADVVYEGRLTRAEFVHGDLSEGRYYWRVRSASGRAESRPGAVRSLRLRQDLDPPDLRVELPRDIVATDELVIRGSAEPGSELFIENENVPLDADGKFEYALQLEPGLNMIVIEAVDAAGNSAYRSQYVTARF